MRLGALTLVLALLLVGPSIADPNAELMERTGLQQLESGDVPTFGKIHRGYPLKMRIAVGDVWRRYFARLAVAEASNGLPEAWRNLYFDRPGPGDIAGSRADQALSQVLGYPLTLTVVVEHEHEVNPVFIYGSRSVYKPLEPPPQQGKLPGTDLKIYSQEPAAAERILADSALVKRLSKLRAPSLAVTSYGASLMWAGDEPQYSAMIRDHKDYADMLNSIFDGLVGLLEAVKTN